MRDPLFPALAPPTAAAAFRVAISVAVAALVPACSRTLSDDSLGERQAAALCVDVQLPPAASFVLTADTREGLNLKSGPCGGAESPEIVFAWKAPSTGTWAVEVSSASFAPVVYALDRPCDTLGSVCDEADEPSARASFAFSADEGAVLHFAVDGARPGAQGPFTVALRSL